MLPVASAQCRNLCNPKWWCKAVPVAGMQRSLEPQTHLIVQKKGLCFNTIPENGTISVGRGGKVLSGEVRMGRDYDELQKTGNMGEVSYMLV